ncbi:MAG: O-antigen ligase family protein [Verrucomicrobia bacterium]|nr:O-antigen ligase family protein [Verrucomicrobiota bacterium]
MIREQLDKWCEWGVLALVLALLVYAPLSVGALRTTDLVVLQWLAAGILALWTLRLWISPEPRLLWPPVCWAVLAFVIYAAARYPSAQIEYVARLELLRVLVYAVVFLAVVNHTARPESVQLIVIALALVAIFTAGYAVWQFFAKSNTVWEFTRMDIYTGRGSGTFMSPNHLAGFLEMVLPLALAFALAGRIGPGLRIFLGYAVIVAAAGVAVTVSRGGWTAAGVSLALLLGWLVALRRRTLAVILGALMLVVVVGALVAGSQITQSRRDNKLKADIASDARFEYWATATAMWKDHPWLGAGPGHYGFVMRRYRPETMQTRPAHPHNDYLELLADFGAAGGAIVAVALVLAGFGVWRAAKFVQRGREDEAPRNSNRFALWIGASTGLAALLVHSFLDHNLHVPANALVAVTLAALLAGLWRHVSERNTVSPGVFVKLLFTLAAIAGGAYLAQQAARLGREQTLLKLASETRPRSAERLELLKRVHAAEPMNAATTYYLGEFHWDLSGQRRADKQEMQTELLHALPWFEKTQKLDPNEPFGFIRYGMCLDRLNQSPAMALPYFQQGERLDPNGHFVQSHLGWHYLQTGDLAAAKRHLERAWRLKPYDNHFAWSQLQTVNTKLKESKITN